MAGKQLSPREFKRILNDNGFTLQRAKGNKLFEITYKKL